MSYSFKNITDKRQIYLKELLQKKGCSVFLSEELSIQEKTNLFSQIHSAPFLYLLPVPAPKEELGFLKHSLHPGITVLGGNLPEDFTNFCAEKNLSFLDYMKEETVIIENAIATAEGIISHAILEAPINIHGSRSLVIGFGRCGEILAERLLSLHAEVFVSTRNPCSMKKAECYGYHLHKSENYPDYDLIFNTAPARVLGKDIIDRLNPDVHIFDIASKPGGTDFSYCKEKDIQAALYPGLPGNCAPKTSAEIIYRYLITIL